MDHMWIGGKSQGVEGGLTPLIKSSQMKSKQEVGDSKNLAV